METENPRKYSQVENLIPRKLNFKLVSHTSYRHDMIRIRPQILSEHLDMRIDRTVIIVLIHFPDR